MGSEAIAKGIRVTNVICGVILAIIGVIKIITLQIFTNFSFTYMMNFFFPFFVVGLGLIIIGCEF
jgi:hypothetical protein